MSDIADFLRARYAEQRAIALAASPGPWQANGEHDEVLAVDGITVAEGFALSGRQLRATVDHIAAHNPATVLADLDAKLAIVDEHPAATGWNGREIDSKVCRTCSETSQDGELAGDVYPCRTLRLLARPFAGHPTTRARSGHRERDRTRHLRHLRHRRRALRARRSVHHLAYRTGRTRSPTQAT